MKIFAYLFAPVLAIGLCSPATAQQKAKKKAAPKTAREVVVHNTRQFTLNEFALSNAEGQNVGVMVAPLAPGKKVTIKFRKGTPCVLTVSAVFDDGSENAGGQIDACKDKAVRFQN